MTSSDLWRADIISWCEYTDEAFRRSTGMLAPGKDYPAAMHPPDNEDRREQYRAWIGALGPSDLACILAIGAMRAAGEL
jgi:hypothetical protein